MADLLSHLSWSNFYSILLFFVYFFILFIWIRDVKVNVLIYEIIVVEINAIKYFNAVNATLFTSGVHWPMARNRRVSAVS